MILPPLMIAVLERRGAFKGPNGKTLSTITSLGACISPPPLAVCFRLWPDCRLTPFWGGMAGLIGTSLLVFLPPAIATFPQRAAVDPRKLEERFRALEYEKVEFNKGL